MSTANIFAYTNAGAGTLVRVSGAVGLEVLEGTIGIALSPEILIVGATVAVGAGAYYLYQRSYGQEPVIVTREMAERLKNTPFYEGGQVVQPFRRAEARHTLPTQQSLQQIHAGVVKGIYDDSLIYYPSTPTTKAGEEVLADFGQCHPDFRSFKSFSSLKEDPLFREVLQNGLQGSSDKWEAHHIVEQNQTATTGSRAIQNTANAILLPERLHLEISRIYTAAPEPTSPEAQFIREHHLRNSRRSYVDRLPYMEQREYGIKTICRAMDTVPLTAEEKQFVKQQLDHRERTQEQIEERKQNRNPNACEEISYQRAPAPLFPNYSIHIREFLGQKSKELGLLHEINERPRGHDRGRGIDIGFG